MTHNLQLTTTAAAAMARRYNRSISALSVVHRGSTTYLHRHFERKNQTSMNNIIHSLVVRYNNVGTAMEANGVVGGFEGMAKAIA